MEITIDLESRSRIDLKKVGMYVYAEHPTTEIMCFAIKSKEDHAKIWVPPQFEHLIPYLSLLYLPIITTEDFQKLVHQAQIIHAHNAGFERIMWVNKMQANHGFKPIPFEKWRCTAALAASYALPRDLDRACKVMQVIEKDKDGHKLMMKMCKPRKNGTWWEKPEEFVRLIEYCLQDVRAEESLDNALLPLPASELEVWRLDQQINDRGFRIDIDAVQNLIEKVGYKEYKLLTRMKEISGIASPRQVAVTQAWLKTQGLTLANLQKTTITKALETPNLAPNLKEVLEIRQSLGKASVSKLKSMIARSSVDGVARGTTMYHGAGTGRWAGRGIQPHNFPRKTLPEQSIDEVLMLNVDLVEMLYGCMFQTASQCLRGMIIADPDHLLLCSDFSQIEARVLAWLAGEDRVLEAFRNGLDLYKVEAMSIYNKSYDNILDDERFVGKTAVLALGYQGWVGAFMAMSKNYGVSLDKSTSQVICRKWRDARPNTVAYWAGVENAAMSAVHDGGSYDYGRIQFFMNGRFLHCRLPSGRLLSYCDPHIRLIEKHGQSKPAIFFWGVDTYSKQWSIQQTYGGKLTENIVQSISRDILAESMLRLAKYNYQIVMHVHDEVVAKHLEPVTPEIMQQFDDLMSVVPTWAQGLPLAAKGWCGKRYKKD